MNSFYKTEQYPARCFVNTPYFMVTELRAEADQRGGTAVHCSIFTSRTLTEVCRVGIPRYIGLRKSKTNIDFGFEIQHRIPSRDN
jgi:hypothetical protein